MTCNPLILWVEHIGIEPMTSWLPVKRSSPENWEILDFFKFSRILVKLNNPLNNRIESFTGPSELKIFYYKIVFGKKFIQPDKWF